MIKVEEKEIKFPPEKKVWLGDRQSKCTLVNLFSGPIIGLFTPRTHSLLRTRPVISERSANNCGVLSPTFGANHTHVCELAPNVGGRPPRALFRDSPHSTIDLLSNPDRGSYTHTRSYARGCCGGRRGEKEATFEPGGCHICYCSRSPTFHK